jgi:hypothetical protein
MTETTEKIVESYVRYVMNWATISNIKCPDQHEIDLLAIDPLSLKRYHIERSVHVPGTGFSKLTNGAFDLAQMKMRVKAPGQRRTIGFFEKQKFGAEGVVKTLKTYGFKPNEYHKIIVTWDCKLEAKETAKKNGIEVWEFPDLLDEISTMVGHGKQYVMDDTIRTLQMLVYAQRRRKVE